MPKPSHSARRRLEKWGFRLAILVGIPIFSVWASIQLTDQRDVYLPKLNQHVKVGAALAIDWSGPGYMNVGGRHLTIHVHFEGPIRPVITISRIGTVPEQSSAYYASLDSNRVTESMGQRLGDGMRSYFTAEVENAAIIALLLCGGWRLAVKLRRRRHELKVESRRPWTKSFWSESISAAGSLCRTLPSVAVSATLCALIVFGGNYRNATADGSTLNGIPGSVTSLDQLFGIQRQQITPAPDPHLHGYNAVVLGDSTAEGYGNPLVAHPTPDDKACGRSIDSYAELMGPASGGLYNAVDLACSGATVTQGLDHPEFKGSVEIPSQLGTLEHIKLGSNPLIIIGVGADDMQWFGQFADCVINLCHDNLSGAIYSLQLNQVTLKLNDDVFDRLADWPGHPRVLVNLYYNPLSSDLSCLTESPSIRHLSDHTGSKEWQQRMQVLAQVLSARITQFNSVLTKEAKTDGLIAVPVNFTGHSVCSAQPYVQAMDSAAPLHPNALGEQAIATADAYALASAATPKIAAGGQTTAN